MSNKVNTYGSNLSDHTKQLLENEKKRQAGLKRLADYNSPGVSIFSKRTAIQAQVDGRRSNSGSAAFASIYQKLTEIRGRTLLIMAAVPTIPVAAYALSGYISELENFLTSAGSRATGLFSLIKDLCASIDFSSIPVDTILQIISRLATYIKEIALLLSLCVVCGLAAVQIFKGSQTVENIPEPRESITPDDAFGHGFFPEGIGFNDFTEHTDENRVKYHSYEAHKKDPLENPLEYYWYPNGKDGVSNPQAFVKWSQTVSWYDEYQYSNNLKFNGHSFEPGFYLTAEPNFHRKKGPRLYQFKQENGVPCFYGFEFFDDENAGYRRFLIDPETFLEIEEIEGTTTAKTVKKTTKLEFKKAFPNNLGLKFELKDNSIPKNFYQDDTKKDRDVMTANKAEWNGPVEYICGEGNIVYSWYPEGKSVDIKGNPVAEAVYCFNNGKRITYTYSQQFTHNGITFEDGFFRVENGTLFEFMVMRQKGQLSTSHYVHMPGTSGADNKGFIEIDPKTFVETTPAKLKFKDAFPNNLGLKFERNTNTSSVKGAILGSGGLEKGTAHIERFVGGIESFSCSDGNMTYYWYPYGKTAGVEGEPVAQAVYNFNDGKSYKTHTYTYQRDFVHKDRSFGDGFFRVDKTTDTLFVFIVSAGENGKRDTTFYARVPEDPNATEEGLIEIDPSTFVDTAPPKTTATAPSVEFQPATQGAETGAKRPQFANLKIGSSSFYVLQGAFQPYRRDVFEDSFMIERVPGVKSLRLKNDAHMLYLWYSNGKPTQDDADYVGDGNPAVMAVYWPVEKELNEEYYRSLDYTSAKLNAAEVEGNPIIPPKAYNYLEKPIFNGISFPDGFYYKLWYGQNLYHFDSETNTHYKIIFDDSLDIKYRSVEINPATDAEIVPEEINSNITVVSSSSLDTTKEVQGIVPTGYTYKNAGELTLFGEPLPAGFYRGRSTTIYKYSPEDNKHFRIIFDSENTQLKYIEYDDVNKKLFWETPSMEWSRALPIGNETFFNLQLTAFKAYNQNELLYLSEIKRSDLPFYLENLTDVTHLRQVDMLYLWYPTGKPRFSEDSGYIEADGNSTLEAIFWPEKKERQGQGEYYRSLNYTSTKILDLKNKGVVPPKIYSHRQNPIFNGIKFPDGFYYRPLKSAEFYKFDSETNTHYQILFDNQLPAKYEAIEIDPADTSLGTLEGQSLGTDQKSAPEEINPDIELVEASPLEFSTAFPGLALDAFLEDYNYGKRQFDCQVSHTLSYHWYPEGLPASGSKGNQSSPVAQVLCKGKYVSDNHTYTYTNDEELSLRGEPLPAGFYYSPKNALYTVYRYSLAYNTHYQVFLDAGKIREVEYNFDTRELLWENYSGGQRSVNPIGGDPFFSQGISKFKSYNEESVLPMGMATSSFALEYIDGVKFVREGDMLYLWYSNGKPYTSGQTEFNLTEKAERYASSFPTVESNNKPARVAVFWPRNKELNGECYRSLNYTSSKLREAKDQGRSITPPKAYEYEVNPIFNGVKFPSGFYYSLNQYKIYKFDSETNKHYEIIFDNELEEKYRLVEIDPETNAEMVPEEVNPDIELVEAAPLEFSDVFPDLDLENFTADQDVQTYTKEVKKETVIETVVYHWYPNGKPMSTGTGPQVKAEVVCTIKEKADPGMNLDFVLKHTETYTYKTEGEVTLHGEALPAGFYSIKDNSDTFMYVPEDDQHYQVIFDSTSATAQVNFVKYAHLLYGRLWEGFNTEYTIEELEGIPSSIDWDKVTDLYMAPHIENGKQIGTYNIENIPNVYSLRDGNMLYLKYPEGMPQKMGSKEVVPNETPAVLAVYWPTSSNGYYKSLSSAQGNNPPKAYEGMLNPVFDGIKFPDGFYYRPKNSTDLFQFEDNKHYKIIFDDSLATKYRSVEIDPETDEEISMGDSL